MTALRTRWADSPGEWPDLAARWRILFEDERAERSPYLAPEWAEAWLRVFGGRLRAAVVESDGLLVGIAPLMRVGAIAPTYVGIGQEVADYGGFLLRDDQPGVADELLGAVESRCLRRPALVSLGRIRAGSLLEEALVRRYARHPRLCLTAWQRDSAPVLDLSRRVDAEREVSRLKKRNDVRRRLRRLQEQHDVTFEYDTSSDPGALGDFLRLHDLRWRQKTGDAVGPFASVRGRRFLAEVVALTAADGLVRLSFVRVDGERLVGRFGFELGDTYYGAKSAFDPRLASYGPGHLAVAFVLDELLLRGLHRFDFMRGEGGHKAAWTRASTSSTFYLLHHRGGSGRLERQLAGARMARRYRWPWSISAPRLDTRTGAPAVGSGGGQTDR